MVSERRRRDAATVSALAALTIAFFPGVLLGRVLVPWDILRLFPPWQVSGPVHNALLSDAVRLYAPWRTLLGASLRQGKLPFWDPYVFGGAPFLANSQAAIFYPPNLLYGILPVDTATTVLVLLHVWLSMVGMYLLARYSGLHLGLTASALAAVGFGFCGFAMVWAEFPTFAAVYTWLPWMMLALFRVMDRPRSLAFAGLALSVAMAALGGHAQIFQYEGLALGVVIIVVGAHSFAGSPVRGLVRLGAAVGGVTAGLLLAAPQLLATLEAAPLIVRGKEPIALLVRDSFPLHLLPLVALPRAYGDSRTDSWFPTGNENEYVAFCGVIVLLLAPLALRHWRRTEVQALLGVEALAWAVALGTPVFKVLYTVVPVMNQVRGIGRATSLHSFALPLLAAIGLEVLLELSHDPTTRRWAVRWIITASALVGALLLIDQHVAVQQFTRDYMVRQYLALVVPSGVAMALLALVVQRRPGAQKLTALLPVLLAAELYLAYGQYNTADPGPNTFAQPNRIVGFLQSHPGRFVTYKSRPVGETLFRNLGDELTGDTPIAATLSTVGGSDTYILRDFGDYFNLIENHEDDLHLNSAPPLVTARALESPLLANVGVRWVVSQEVPSTPASDGRNVSPNPPPAPVFRAVPDMIYATRVALPLLRQLTCLQSVASEAEVLTVLRNSPTLVYARGVTADRVPADAICPTVGADLTAESAVSSVAIGPDGSSSAMVDAGAPTTIMYAETRYPGWIVRIDDQPAHLIRVDHAFMGVVVPAGHHYVDFSYHPARLGLGIGVAACAMVLILLVAFTPPMLRRRRAGQRGK